MSDKRRDVPWWSGICPFPGNLLVFRLTSMEYFWLPPRALKVPTKGGQKKKSSWEKGFPGPVFGLCLARVSRKNICIVTFNVVRFGMVQVGSEFTAHSLQFADSMQSSSKTNEQKFYQPPTQTLNYPGSSAFKKPNHSYLHAETKIFANEQQVARRYQ